MALAAQHYGGIYKLTLSVCGIRDPNKSFYRYGTKYLRQFFDIVFFTIPMCSHIPQVSLGGLTTPPHRYMCGHINLMP